MKFSLTTICTVAILAAAANAARPAVKSNTNSIRGTNATDKLNSMKTNAQQTVQTAVDNGKNKWSNAKDTAKGKYDQKKTTVKSNVNQKKAHATSSAQEKATAAVQDATAKAQQAAQDVTAKTQPSALDATAKVNSALKTGSTFGAKIPVTKAADHRNQTEDDHEMLVKMSAEIDQLVALLGASSDTEATTADWFGQNADKFSPSTGLGAVAPTSPSKLGAVAAPHHGAVAAP